MPTSTATQLRDAPSASILSGTAANLAAGGISSLYYPSSEKHDAQVTVDNFFIGVGTGAIGPSSRRSSSNTSPMEYRLRLWQILSP